MRRFRKSDIPRLRQIYEDAGYSFGFENLLPKKGQCAKVIVEGGLVVGIAKARKTAEVIAMVDPQYGSPHRRLKVFADLHLPLAEWMESKGIEIATAFTDPKYPKFGERLSRLGWSESLWRSFYVRVKDVIEALKG